MDLQHQTGFTLIELMVTLSVIAILAMLSTSVGDMVVDNRRAAAVNDMLATLNYTRYQALSTGRNVTICQSSNPTASTPTCGTGTGWEAGWVVFLNDANATSPAAAADVLKVHSPLSDAVSLRSAVTALTFNRLGISTTAGDLMLCDKRGFGTSPVYARQISVSAGGRVRSTTPTSGSCP